MALWGCKCPLRRLPFSGAVALALCGGSVRSVQRPGGVAVPLYPCPVAWLCASSVRRCGGVPRAALWYSVPPGLWRRWTREKPGQAVQAPPGQKRTAAGIVPGAALVHLFIFKSSDKIANGIIKRTSNTNIFDFHPLYYAALYCLCVGVSCTSRRISFIAAFMAAMVSL